MSKHVTWEGVFPAVTTQFRDDFSVDVAATHKVIQALVRDGVSGLIMCGTVGENCSLSRCRARRADGGGARRRRRQGADHRRHRRVHHRARLRDGPRGAAREDGRHHGHAGAGLRRASRARPPRTTATCPRRPTCRSWSTTTRRSTATTSPRTILDFARRLRDVVCFKDSSGDTRRFIDVRNDVGDRFVLFAGLDDVVLESIARRGRGLGVGHVQRVPEGRRDASSAWPGRPFRRSACRSTTGSCRCCTSTRGPTWSSASSSAST